MRSIGLAVLVALAAVPAGDAAAADKFSKMLDDAKRAGRRCTWSVGSPGVVSVARTK